MAGVAYLAAGIEHDEVGAPTVSGDVHRRMTAKRMEKLNPLKDRRDLFTVEGDKDAPLALVSWGSVAGAAREALELVRDKASRTPDKERTTAAVRRACERGIVLVLDEVQTGSARTGKLFACEHYGIEPDLVTLAKSMGGGLPISAVTGRADLMDAAQTGGLGGTYVGNPVACAAALAAIEFIERERLWERAAAIGERVRARFESWRDRYEQVGDARGLGAMRALELVRDKVSRAPDKERTTAAVRRACERGLLLISAGTHGNVIRTLMPLVITDAQLDEGLEVLEHALA